jgi:septal ring factor EnvC (AmiA/AmiB activator)
MPLTPKNKELEQLKKENARLKAALGESEFECQRLEIINSNLETQLNESTRELEKNIEVLQSLKKEIETLVDDLKGDNK